MPRSSVLLARVKDERNVSVAKNFGQALHVFDVAGSDNGKINIRYLAFTSVFHRSRIQRRNLVIRRIGHNAGKSGFFIRYNFHRTQANIVLVKPGLIAVKVIAGASKDNGLFFEQS